MGFIKVDKFLCCVTLESGGLIVGWFTVIISMITIAMLIGIMVWMTSLYNRVDPVHPSDETLLLAVFLTVIIICSIYLIYYVVLLIASFLLLRSTRKRDHNNMMLFIVLMAIGVVISFLQVLTVGWAGLGFAVFMAAIDLYFFVCIYSLYDLFRNERLGPNNQIPMQNQTVIYTQPQQQPYAYQPQPVLYAQPPVYQPQQTFQQPPIIVQSSAPIPTNGDQNQQKIMVY